MPKFYYYLYFGRYRLLCVLITGLWILLLLGLGLGLMQYKIQTLATRSKHLTSTLTKLQIKLIALVKKHHTPKTNVASLLPALALNPALNRFLQQRHLHLENSRQLDKHTLNLTLRGPGIFLLDSVLYLLEHANFTIAHWQLSHRAESGNILHTDTLDLKLLLSPKRHPSYQAPDTLPTNTPLFKHQALETNIPFIGSLSAKGQRTLLSINGQRKLIPLQTKDKIGKLRWELVKIGPYHARFCLVLLSGAYCIDKAYLYHVAIGSGL